MNPLSFYRLFLVVYLWQYVDLKQDFQSSQQATVKDCLQKYCSDQPVYIRTVTKISSWQSCYKECLLKIRKQSFVGTRHINPFFKRIRRDDAIAKENSTQVVYTKDRHEECKNATNKATALSDEDINITISKPGNTGRRLVIVSWNPRPNMTANWTGYKMIYAIGDSWRNWRFDCRDLGKNATFSIINIPSNVLRELKKTRIEVLITSLPYLRSESINHWKGRYLGHELTKHEERHEECKKASNKATALSDEDINIAISKPGNTGRRLVNVSWNPRPNMTANWTGYKMIWAMIGDNSRDWRFDCRDLGKNATFSIIDIPSNVLRELEKPRIAVVITSLPYLRSESIYHWKGRYLDQKQG